MRHICCDELKRHRSPAVSLWLNFSCVAYPSCLKNEFCFERSLSVRVDCVRDAQLRPAVSTQKKNKNGSGQQWEKKTASERKQKSHRLEPPRKEDGDELESKEEMQAMEMVQEKRGGSSGFWSGHGCVATSNDTCPEEPGSQYNLW